jgi:hypothetical protein
MNGSSKLHTKTNNELITVKSASEWQGVATSGGSGRLSLLEKASRRTMLCTVGKPGGKRLSSPSLTASSRSSMPSWEKNNRIPGLILCLDSIKKQRTDETDTGIS